MPVPTKPLVKIPLPNPVGGVIRTKGREEEVQVPHLNDALNVLPYDLLGRKRIGQREGLTVLYNLAPAGGFNSIIQGLLPVGYIVPPGTFITNPPFVEVDAPNFNVYANMFSTAGLVVGQGPVSTNWIVAPLSPIGIQINLTLNVFSTLTDSGGMFDPKPNNNLAVDFAVVQQFQVIDAALNTSGPISVDAEIQWWTCRTGGTLINGYYVPPPPSGYATTIFFAIIAGGTPAVISEQNFQIGGPDLPTQTASATYSFGIQVQNGSTWTGVGSVEGVLTPLGNNMVPTVGKPISTTALSTSLASSPLAPTPFNTSSTYCTLVIQ